MSTYITEHQKLHEEIKQKDLVIENLNNQLQTSVTEINKLNGALVESNQTIEVMKNNETWLTEQCGYYFGNAIQISATRRVKKMENLQQMNKSEREDQFVKICNFYINGRGHGQFLENELQEKVRFHAFERKEEIDFDSDKDEEGWIKPLRREVVDEEDELDPLRENQ